MPLVNLAEHREQPDATIVEDCERLLAAAKAGTIRGIIACTVDAGRTVTTTFNLGDGGIAAMNLAIDYAKRRVLAAGEEE